MFRELEPGLELLRARGRTRCVLGLRDVLDDPETAHREWLAMAGDTAVRTYYDAVWVYGDPKVYDPVREYGFPPDVAGKIRYTGYLGRAANNGASVDDDGSLLAGLGLPPGRLVLCVVGGGQDGDHLAGTFAQAELPPDTNGVIVTGPFMPPDARRNLHTLAATRPRLGVVEFTTEPERLVHLADSVVAMGGYNTICVMHLHAHFGSVATTVARLASHFAGVTYSFTAHAKDIYHESVRPDDLRRKLRGALAVITVSDYNLRHLRQTYGPAAARVQRVYNGLDLRQFDYRSPRSRPARIVAVGRLVEKKGFADLIDACAILMRRGYDFHCQIIGTGPLEADLRARIQRLGLQGRVELLGPRPQSQVISHVQRAAVFAAPCVVGSDGNRDGLPTVLLEAIAMGTPCVSTDVTGIPEVLRHGETGLMVPQHDPTALAMALERLLGDPALRVRLSTRARSLIEARFDIHRNAARIREIFATAGHPAGQVVVAEVA